MRCHDCIFVWMLGSVARVEMTEAEVEVRVENNVATPNTSDNNQIFIAALSGWQHLCQSVGLAFWSSTKWSAVVVVSAPLLWCSYRLFWVSKQSSSIWWLWCVVGSHTLKFDVSLKFLFWFVGSSSSIIFQDKRCATFLLRIPKIMQDIYGRF